MVAAAQIDLLHNSRVFGRAGNHVANLAVRIIDGTVNRP
jgi:hypothetical protein